MKPDDVTALKDYASLIWRIALIWVTGILMVGCQATAPRAKGNFPIPKLPSQFYSDGISVEPLNRKPEPARGAWWQQFGSRELDGLVQRALIGNSDLKIAALRIQQASIRLEQTKAGDLPTLTTPLRAVAQRGSGVVDSQQSSQAVFQANWRLDVWGEQQGMVESAELQWVRAVHEKENLQRVVLGNLVSTYVAYLANNDAMDLARKNEQVAQEILVTLEQRFRMGDATANELEQQRSAISLQRAVMPSLMNQQENLRTNLARLTGVLPHEVTVSDRGVESLMTPVVNPGLPSALLLNRPDIRMVEARMRAANADIDVARARLMPTIDLNMQAGFNGPSLLQLFNPQNLLVNAATSLVSTIFDGGRRQGNQAIAQSYYEEMVETYAETIYQAVREVDSAVTQLRTSKETLEARQSNTRSALSMFKIASDAYELGAVDLTTVLEARNRYQASNEALLRSRSDVLNAYIMLASFVGTLGNV